MNPSWKRASPTGPPPCSRLRRACCAVCPTRPWPRRMRNRAAAMLSSETKGFLRKKTKLSCAPPEKIDRDWERDRNPRQSSLWSRPAGLLGRDRARGRPPFALDEEVRPGAGRAHRGRLRRSIRRGRARGLVGGGGPLCRRRSRLRGLADPALESLGRRGRTDEGERAGRRWNG